MANPVYTINSGIGGSGEYLSVKTSVSGSPDDFVYATITSGTDPNITHGSLPSRTAYYHSIAKGDSAFNKNLNATNPTLSPAPPAVPPDTVPAWLLLHDAEDFSIGTGIPNIRIVTNGRRKRVYSTPNWTTLNFQGAGHVFVSSEDQVAINATNGVVTIEGGYKFGTVTTTENNSSHKFNIDNENQYIRAHSTDPITHSDIWTKDADNNFRLNTGYKPDNVTITSGTGNYIFTYAGDDTVLQKNNGSNWIYGGDGMDSIAIQSDNWGTVDGCNGKDTINFRRNDAHVYGGGDNDFISVISDNDALNTIHGGPSGTSGSGLDRPDTSDTIKAGTFSKMWGDGGADSISAISYNTIYGGWSAVGIAGATTINQQYPNYKYGPDSSDSIYAVNYNYIAGCGAGDSIVANQYNTIYGGLSRGLPSDISDYDDGGTDASGFQTKEGPTTDTVADGADSIKAVLGNKIYAGGDKDTVDAMYANLIFGGAGDDSIKALDKNSIAGGAGADCIKAGEHSYIDAGPNDNGTTDVIDAGFDSSVWGGSGSDSIKVDNTSYVNAGNDNDSIWGKDDSTIYGAAGKDFIDATDGNIIYGDGTDSVNVSSSISSYTTAHGALLGLSRTESGNADNDTIQAKNRNTMHGGWGDDSIIGTDFNLAYGDAGKDTLYLDSNNSIWGGAGSDIIKATDHNLIYGDDSSGVDPGAGDDSIVARTDDTIYGGAGKDTIIADDAAKIDAGTGDDSISFGMNSSIVAGTGDDTIVSQAPGSSTAPNGSAGSSIWGGRGDMDSLGRPVYAWGTDSHGNRIPVDPKTAGATDVHGHNVFTGADALVTIMDFKFGNDVIHFGKAFEASAVTAFGYGNSTIVPTTDYQIYTAGTDRINVAATISDAANIDMQNETGKFVIFGNPNGTLKGGFANTLIGGRNDDTIYGGEGDYIYGGLGNDTINLNGYNGWRDHVGLTDEGGTDTVTSFQQGWGEGDDVVWYNVPLKKELTDANGKVTDVVITNTDAEADLNDADVHVVGDKTILTQGHGSLILNGVTHGEILVEDGKGVYRAALLGDGYFNDSTRGGQIFIGRKKYSDKVSFEKNNHDLVVDLGMTKRFKEKSAKYYSIEQVIGGSGNNTLVGAKNVRNTLEGGVGTSSIWGGGASADLMVSGTGSATDHYTTFFYGAGDGDDTIEGFRTTDASEAHFKRDTLDIHSGDVTSVRKKGIDIVLTMAGRGDRLTIRNAASGLFDQLIEVNVMGRKTAAKITGADEVITYDPHAQYYFANIPAGATIRNFGDNTRIYLDGRTGDYYRGITNIDVDRGNRLELAGDAANNRITYSGRGTASLYGSFGDDTLTGSKDGMNRFFFGKSDGNDIITRSTADDKVMLYDVALEDVVSAEAKNGTMRIALKSGAHLAIQHFDVNAVHDFKLATGDTWVYNHNATGGGFWSPKSNSPAQR